MKFLEIIREGLQEVNKNYQLIILHTLLLIVAFLLFVFIVGVPLVIVVTKMGLELPENGLSGLVEFFLKEGAAGYSYLIFTLLLSLLIYLLIASVMVIYTMAATAGILISSIRKEGRYSWSLFKYYGKRLFTKFLGFAFIGFLVFLVISFFAGVLGGLSKIPEPSSLDFWRSFFANLLVLLSVILSFGIILLFMAIFTYGAGFIVLREEGVIPALRDAINFLIRSPEGFIFYILLSLGGIIITLIAGLFGMIFKGFSFALYQLILSVVQIYVNLVILSSAFIYLYRSLEVKSEASEIRGP